MQTLLIDVVIACITIFLVWRFVKFLIRYREWCDITRKMAALGDTHPVWGSLHLFDDVSGYIDVVLKLVQDVRPKVYQAWVMFMYPVFSVCHPDTAKILLKSSEPKPKYHDGGGYTVVMPWLGDGLLLSDGKKWERNRRMLTPAFHFDILRPYVKVYNEVADIFLENMKNTNNKDGDVLANEFVTLATLDTMLRCSLSYEGNIQEEGKNHPYVKAVSRLGYIAMTRMIRPWLYKDWVFYISSLGREFRKHCNFVHQFADEIINSRRQALTRDPSQLEKRRLDFLDILVTARDENGDGLSDIDIRAEVDTFLFEGHDTTASAISWAIYCLGKYPKHQQTLYEETKHVLQGRTYIEWEDIPHFKKLLLFIKEVMRMHSTVPIISRWLTKPTEIDGVVLPKHFPCDIVIHAINHHPDVWPDHMEFRPGRFAEEECKDRDPYNYVPFSAGSRNCIGQHFALNEQKVMLARLINRFHVELVPGHEYIEMPELVMRSKYGIKVHLRERDNETEGDGSFI